MKVLLAGGGTAGHINPAISIASYITEIDKKARILYVGNKGAMEETLVRRANLDFAGINISGFSRKKSLKGIKDNFLTIKRLIASILKSKKILKSFKPDFCIGTGGYVSGPVLWQAANMKIPIYIHEQNAFPGITTRLLAKKATYVFLGIEDAKKHLSKTAKTKFTGNPVRKEIITCVKSTSRKKLGLDERPVILSFGGSLGAENINRAVLELILDSAKENKFQHIHAYGRYGKWFVPELEKRGVNLKNFPNFYIREYLNDMPMCLASADLVICRSGAISLSELAIQGKPCILIPSPNVTANHQYYNAMSLVNRNAAFMINEKDLTGETLISCVNKLVLNKELLKTYSTNISKLAVVDACAKILDSISEKFKFVQVK